MSPTFDEYLAELLQIADAPNGLPRTHAAYRKLKILTELYSVAPTGPGTEQMGFCIKQLYEEIFQDLRTIGLFHEDWTLISLVDCMDTELTIQYQK